jgi:5-oxoprolinase (ATP-hydrolysing)
VRRSFLAYAAGPRDPSIRSPTLICADTGGTFTDCLAITAHTTRRAKVLSSGVLPARVVGLSGGRTCRIALAAPPAPGTLAGFRVTKRGSTQEAATEAAVIASHAASDTITLDRDLGLAVGDVLDLSTGEPAPVLAARLALGIPAGTPLENISFRLATTRGTNALLERTLTPTALFVTRGFRDLLLIGDQRRPDLFALDIRRPAPLSSHVVEVDERLDSHGWEVSTLNLASLEGPIAELRAQGVRAAAIALLHSWRNPSHEETLATHLRSRGFHVVSRSADLSPRIRIVPRAQTAVVNSALSGPIDDFRRAIHRAVDAAGSGAPRSSIHFMTSAGGLVRADEFHPKDSLLSGPAAGMVGAAAAAVRSGFGRVVTFDMGGTSTDAARFDSAFDYAQSHAVAGVHLLAPAFAIESVAAGGGSICRLENGVPLVGPQSAGASPGPACYGRGGPLTITDVNLLLGRLAPDRFQIPIDPGAAGRAADEALPGLAGDERRAMLEGLLAIANQRMADAIRAISVRRGYDPRECALLAFGGAGPQHACAVADLLGIRTVLIPADASLLSAAGLAEAAVERFAERQVLRPLDAIARDLWDMSEDVAESARDQLIAEGATREDVRIARRLVSLRYLGQDHAEEFELARAADVAGLPEAFAARATRIFGHAPREKPVEVESLRVIAQATSPTQREGAGWASEPTAESAAAGPQIAAFGAVRDIPHSFPRVERATLTLAPIQGPALVTEERTTTLVEPGWTARADAAGALILERQEEPHARAAHPAAVREELLAHRLDAIAEEMGQTLRRTSLSVNVKERLDFSCAILDAEGRLVVSAPHVPVHLGALGICVRKVQAALGLRTGDIAVTNHPAFGGSHLPDVTVVMPVFDAAGERLAFVAARAHHAEIGGIRPGSMPPSATTLAEEGVVIPPTLLFERGEPRWERVESMLRAGPYPSRAVADNLADLGAAVAACRRGAEQITSLASRDVAAALAGTLRRAAHAASGAIAAWLERQNSNQGADQSSGAEEILDDGARIPVQIRTEASPFATPSAPRLVLDFSGTSGTHPRNLNAPEAVVRSAIAYVVRVLVGQVAPKLADNLPLSEGLLDSLEIRVPPGILAPSFTGDAARDPAVAGGNVETSQRLVNCLLRALGLCAASQGTMNNFLFGASTSRSSSNQNVPSYYETICGGCGAGPGFAGASGVHSHMTNTAITDPEILEFRHPVMLERFEIRDDEAARAGGDGEFKGGRGVVREVRFLEPRSVSILSQHRAAPLEPIAGIKAARGPAGAAGGDAGAPGENWLLPVDGPPVALGPSAELDVRPGDRILIRTPGGGGWGRPQEKAHTDRNL